MLIHEMWSRLAADGAHLTAHLQHVPPPVLDLGENGKRSCFAGEHGVHGS